MAYDNNNQPLVDYLKVKQHINNLGDSSFLNFLKIGLREYAANNINEKHIVNTVKQTAGEDLAPYEALLSEFRDVFTDAVAFTSKGKGRKQISYAEAVKQDSNSDSSRPNSPSPKMNKKMKKTAPVSKTSSSSTSCKAPKKQPTTPALKTISTVITGYNPKIKENIQEITVYDIPFRWTQLDVLNHLKAWDQVIAIKFKSQQK
ncbi:hypothetical protein GLOIN_2v1768822 [Rhizophagus irregularis DAOM 181602=DAOM 197198]|uniref:Uncharacterized protein n=1 Tax=Rhizophagus irregularis (strain DAOM 181602 / DAOM 197198 / MUCL 43194) TaxID=747089 RepID=A0A2H5RLZ8_RHIID|nr:hypothetical protein GLOIN_2v1768822 [Rhizophagus irregularis DAOM 181602=DAOM 197198]POG76681.1 hypothetical protein GLOIN_2v1768822 [Rhizophagus irregularis DAOM 181602=DAOM 197198]|eukprot:XP_025183547.1 hypothetical protein GLOIN_2v1768822 [Rhizophagus irregularis DAOM 181602=DAOM 197198]